jgi:hypothetical protein
VPVVTVVVLSPYVVPGTTMGVDNVLTVAEFGLVPVLTPTVCVV